MGDACVWEFYDAQVNDPSRYDYCYRMTAR